MVFILRVRGRGGTKRLMFADSPTPTYQALQLQIVDLFGVKPEQQKLSRKPLHAPEWVVAKSTDTFTTLKLNHGDELYLSGEDASATSSSTSSSSAPTSTPTTSSTSSLSRPTSAASTAKLTSRCNHGPRGRCPHCDGPQPGATPKGKCNHGLGATCMHCSEHVNDTKAEPAAWLCNHPDNVFCPKCIPPENDDEKYKNRVLPCTCDKKHGQSCIRCADKGPVIKVDKIPYSRFMDERKALCKYKHGPQTTCAFCADPALPSFTGKKNCDKGHRPWPHGVCLSCAPANATLREQGYRHCDSISVETKIIENFYKNWMRRGSHLQRAAILFGKYVDEPEETKNPGAIRAEVYALYEPPQENQPTGVRFLRDPQEKIVHDVAARLGLEPVGWVITTLERKEDQKYGGKILASAAEVQQAARFQNRYKNNVGHSRFVTIIIEHANEVVPRAYQVSDLAVAMERDGVFGAASDPYMMATRIPAKGEMTPTVVYKDKPLLPGDEFLPDELIVKVILTTPKNPHSLLKHHDFPSVGTDAAVRSHMSQYGREEYASKLADFNLLIYLASKLSNPEIVNQVADAIRQRQPLPAPLKAQLDQALIEKQLI